MGMLLFRTNAVMTKVENNGQGKGKMLDRRNCEHEKRWTGEMLDRRDNVKK